MNSVFLLSHLCQYPDGTESIKAIGIYSTEEEAIAAISRLKDKPGFVYHQAGFGYGKYEINRDHWTDGFVDPFSEPDEAA